MKIEIIPNDNEKEREDKQGRVYASHRRTWLLIINGEFHSEHKTVREASARAARLSAKF